MSERALKQALGVEIDCEQNADNIIRSSPSAKSSYCLHEQEQVMPCLFTASATNYAVEVLQVSGIIASSSSTFRLAGGSEPSTALSRNAGGDLETC